ncbi:MAG TPA: PaaI family thioesterase [Kofleriaceae bacterium]|jgi:uncharacterized protein (TIGR00369 family)
MPDAQRFALVATFAKHVPQNVALGIRIVNITTDGCTFELPYADFLVGNPDTGVIHGGAITTLLDGISGCAVFALVEKMMPIATLDLRIDYLRPAEPHKSVFAHAVCYHMSKNVAFTRAVAYQDSLEHPIANAVGTFMLDTKRGPK